MTGPQSKSRLLTLGPIHYVYVTIVVLVIGPFTVMTMYSQDFFDGYVRTFIGPRLQRKFGFKMEMRRMYYRKKQAVSVFVIKNLTPDGEFARLGVRNCDVPVSFTHMSDASLYRKLEKSESRKVEIRFVDCGTYERELESGDLFLAPHEHKIFPLTNEKRFRSSSFLQDWLL